MAEMHLTVAALKRRGWTDAKIRDWLGPADKTGVNPVYRTAAPLRLYAEDRVRAVEEAHPAWFAQRSVKVVANAERAVGKAEQVKAANLATAQQWSDWASQVEIRVMPLNQMSEKKARRLADLHAIEVSDNPPRGNRALNNWLRHCRTNYDDLLLEMGGGHERAYQVLRNRVEQAIRDVYPWAPAADKPRESPYDDMWAEVEALDCARQRLEKAKAMVKERAAAVAVA